MAISTPINVGTANVKASATTTLTTTTVATIPAGSLVIVGLSCNSAAIPAALSLGSLGFAGQGIINGTAQATLYYGYTTSSIASGSTITSTFSATGFTAALSACYVTGTDPYVLIDVFNTGGGTGTAVSISTGTSTYAGDLAIAVLSINGPSGDGFTQATTWATPPNAAGTSGGGSTTNWTVRGGYKINASTSSVNYNPTLGTSRTWAGVIATFPARIPLKASVIESNSTLGNAVDCTSSVIVNQSASYGVSNGLKFGNSFIAPKTGQLGNFKASVYSQNSISNPTTLGAIELWQLTTNNVLAAPSTLLASYPIAWRDIPYTGPVTTGYNSIEYDLSAVSGMTVTAGTGYSIVIASGSDWGTINVSSWAINSGTPLSPGLYAWVIYNAGWNISNTSLFGIELDYSNATTNSQIGALAAINVTASEAVTATESETSGITKSVSQTETAAATESEIAGTSTNSTITETGTANNTQTATYNTTSSITESVTASESETSNIDKTTTITESVTSTETQISIVTLEVSDTETVTATESASAGNVSDRSITESVTATETETAGFVALSDITETVTATESEIAETINKTYITEANPPLQSLVKSATVTAGSSEQQFIIADNTKAGVTFIAPYTGQLGNFKACVSTFLNIWPDPVMDGTVELWDLTSNSLSSNPNNLLASTPLPYANLTYNQSGSPNVSCDLSSVAGMNVVAGTAYAIVIGGGADWTFGTNNTWIFTLTKIPLSLYGAVSYGGSWSNYYNVYNPCGVELDYLNVTTDTVVASGGTISEDITETVTANNTQIGVISEYAVITEDAPATEAQTAVFTSPQTITETVTATETQSNINTAGAVITETVTALDTEDGGLGTLVDITETVTATETESALNTAGAVITESAPATEDATAANTSPQTITETVTATETQTNTNTAGADITESVTATESELAGKLTSATITETALLDSSATVLVTFSGTIIETASAANTQTASKIVYPTITETVNALATQIGGVLSYQTITESVTATNTQTGGLFAGGFITETVTVTNSQTVLNTAGAFITEPVNASDLVNALVSFSAYITETVHATDRFTARGWDIIPDGQTPNWGPIDDSQTVTWTAVSTSQNPNWVIINDNQ